ncbi:MAG: L-threonylcarbamoyladenylate synthase [Candidatus Saccharimonadales bacterium]
MFSQAKELLEHPGSIGVMPTDTVYGVVARATDKVAVERLYQLKKRDHKPGTIIAADIEQLVSLDLKRRYLKAVEQFWPGSISVVISCGSAELEYLHLGLSSLAVRIPADEELHQLLNQTGPLLTSSANTPGDPTANTVAEAKRYLGNRVDFYEDGGDLSGRQPSTLIRMVDDAVEVLRQGAGPKLDLS